MWGYVFAGDRGSRDQQRYADYNLPKHVIDPVAHIADYKHLSPLTSAPSKSYCLYILLLVCKKLRREGDTLDTN